MPTTIWDTNQKTASITLSVSNTKATASNTSGQAGVRSTRVLTGPTYAEFVPNSLTGGTLLLGLADYAWAFSTNALGSTSDSLSYQSSGAVKLNNSTVSTIQTFTTSDVVRLAVSLTLQQIWFNVNSGNWNNNGSNVPSDDPAVAVGGISFATLNAFALFFAFGSSGAAANTNAATAAFSSGGWALSAPSGFASVDSVGVAAATASSLPSATSPYLGAARQDPYTGTAQRVAIQSTAGYGPGGSTSISGTVTENGSPVAKLVRLYDQNTGAFLGTVTSAGDGTYSIPAFGRTKVFAVAFDAPSFQAIAKDYVTPA